jgi:hypothetical protein
MNIEMVSSSLTLQVGKDGDHSDRAKKWERDKTLLF